MQLEHNLENKIEEILKQLPEKDLNFLNFLDKINNEKSKNDLYYLDKMEVNEEDLKIVLDAVRLRSDINLHLKELGNITEYQRENEEKTNFQSMLVEISFSKYLWDKYKNLSKYLKNKVEIKSPEIASVFLNKTKEDFYINNKLKNIVLNFDIKSQFLNNRYQSVNINQLAHKRFEEHKSDFYVVGLIDGNPEDFKSVKNIYFVLMSLSYFYQNKEDINNPPRPEIKKFSPYHRLDMINFKKTINI